MKTLDGIEAVKNEEKALKEAQAREAERLRRRREMEDLRRHVDELCDDRIPAHWHVMDRFGTWPPFND